MRKTGKLPRSGGRVPLVIKITLPLCMLCAALIIGLFVCAFQKGRAKQAVSAKGAQSAEADTEERIPEETEALADTETAPAEEQEETAAEEVSYAVCTISGESVEKDLTLYIKDAENVRISGVEFTVKLTSPEEAETLRQYQEELDALNSLLHIPEEEKEVRDTVRSRMETACRKTVADRQEMLLDRKQAVIAEYAGVLEGLEGESYTDEDRDGMIEIEPIAAGDYSACYVPVACYDAEQYVVDVNVKDQIEYKVVESIQDKVVSAQEAGDVKQTHANTVVEEVRKDTVVLEESQKSATEAEYREKEGFTLILQPEVSEETEERSGTYMAVSGENSGTEAETVAVTSRISISRSVKLYAAAGAESAEILASVSNVTAESLSISETLQNMLTVEITQKGYRITLKDPAGVTDDLAGELVFSGLDAGGNPLTVSCAVTIVGGNTALTDEDGTELYVYDSSQVMVPATVGNYQQGNRYYIKIKDEVVVYHGWQTIDGVQYYFDENGNPVTGVQIIGGVEYHFRSDGSLMTDGYGIDVSKWQGNIDWSKASTVISFAIIRCGFRGTSGKIAEDPYAVANIAGARANGVKVGLYFYSMAMTEAQAVEEASLAVSMARANGGVDLPIYIDMEDSCQLALTTAQRDAIVLAFCKTVQNSGYSAGVYANKNWLTTYLTPSKYTGISVWCAQYNTVCTYTGPYDIWQYSCSGTIPGISGYVDLNKGYF